MGASSSKNKKEHKTKEKKEINSSINYGFFQVRYFKFKKF